MSLEIHTYKRFAVVVKYTGNETQVEIPETYHNLPVTQIRENAFANSPVETVIIPNCLQSIGANAFADCSNLYFIGFMPGKGAEEDPDQNTFITPDSLCVFPAALHTVEDGAFRNTALCQVDFRSATLRLGDGVFENCHQLQIAGFMKCTNLTFGLGVFKNSSLERLFAPKARMDTIPDYTFANCPNLVSVLLRFSAAGIRAFYGCTKLERVCAPYPLRDTGSEAFVGCVNLPLYGRPPREQPEPVPEPSKPADPALQNGRLALLNTLRRVQLQKMLCQDEEASQPNSNQDAYDPDGPLFMLQILHCDRDPRMIPSRIKGVWEQEGDQYVFRLRSPAPLKGTRMQIMPSAGLANLAPVMNYFLDKNRDVTLDGKVVGQTYAVCDLSPTEEDFSSGFFREMIRRLNRPMPEKDAGTLRPDSFSMHTDEEFDAYMEICGPAMPGWLNNAYRKNRDMCRGSFGSIHSDERKHARRTLEVLLNIDWMPHVVDVPSVKVARTILDEYFFGLEEVKIRVEEIVAQIRRTGKLPKWGILLHGSAGTGKTSIAKAIAKILSMPIIQMDMSSLGVKPDEISGSSRIYTNARPGMLATTMYKLRSSTAILLANEVDKAGEGSGGRTASDILLTILDKTGFYENFLEEVIPTNNLFCIGTCNDLSTISKPLRDRFLVIHVPDYSPVEKKAIFRNYVFPTVSKDNNITPQQMDVSEEALDLLVAEYAREPGARDLEQYAERLVGNFCRQDDDRDTSGTTFTYSQEDISNLFGPKKKVPQYFATHPGEVNAAFYFDGKAHFYLMEAGISPGEGKFEVLGPMSALQKEYCKVAYLCVRNTINRAVCDLSLYDVTVFVPQPLPDEAENLVGFACYAAICSRILNLDLALQDTCFVGGCDLNGSLYFGQSDLTPLMQAMKARGVSTLYAPMGVNQLLNDRAGKDYNMTIIEGPDATTLFGLAVAQSNLRC